jgi:hypothetical protein
MAVDFEIIQYLLGKSTVIIHTFCLPVEIVLSFAETGGPANCPVIKKGGGFGRQGGELPFFSPKVFPITEIQ